MAFVLSFFTRSNYVLGCSVIAVAVSAAALVGWVADVALLRSFLPGLPPMHPLSSVALAVLAVGLASTLLKHENPASRLLPLAAGLAVAVSSLAGIAARVHLIAEAAAGSPVLEVTGKGGVSYNIPSPNTPLILLLLGLALIFLRNGSRDKWLSEVLAAAALIGTFAMALGQIYEAEAPILMAGSGGIALPTELLFALLPTAMIVRNSRSRLVRLFVSESLGGSAARRLIPAVVIVPTLMGWLQVLGQERGFFNPGLGAAASTFMLVVLMLAIILFYSRAVHAADRRSRLVQAELADKETRYRLLVDHGQGSISTHDLEGVLLSINPAGMRALGYEEHEMVGHSLREFLPRSLYPAFDAYLRRVTHEGIADGIFTMRAKDGRTLTFRFHNVLVTDDGIEPYVLGHAQDVTELLAAQQELKNLSLTDELTGLYNRRGFLTLAEQQLKLEQHNGTARGLTLMFADMDGLKAINDTYGHEAGSTAIVIFSRLVRSVVRGADLVARWGGDEFVILSIGAHDENIQLMVDRIYERLDEHNAESREPYLIACSIGTAQIDLDGEKGLEEIISEADAAMYEEKKRRKAARGDLESDAPHSFVRPWMGHSPRV